LPSRPSCACPPHRRRCPEPDEVLSYEPRPKPDEPHLIPDEPRFIPL